MSDYLLSVDPSIVNKNLALAGFYQGKLHKVCSWSDKRYPEKGIGKVDPYGLLRQKSQIEWLTHQIHLLKLKFPNDTNFILLIENNVGGVAWDMKRVNNLKLLLRSTITIVTVAIIHGFEIVEVDPAKFPLPKPQRKLIVDHEYATFFTSDEIDAIYRGSILKNLPRELWSQYQ